MLAMSHYKVSDVLPIQNLVENLIWNILIEKQSKRSINQITMGLLFLQLMNFTDKLYVGKTNFEEELMIKLLSFIEKIIRRVVLLILPIYFIVYPSLVKPYDKKNYRENIYPTKANQEVRSSSLSTYYN